MGVKLKAGVPQDAFSSEGQLWGNPTYDWKAIEADGFRYWIERFKMPKLFWAPEMKLVFDVFKIDHARGLVDYWGVPVESDTAKIGQWYPGPKDKFFKALREAFGDISCILEDLGIITDEVREFIKRQEYPGMAVLQFGFYRDPNNTNFKGNVWENVVYYTGTHDNQTIVSSIKKEVAERGNQVLYELGLTPVVITNGDNQAIAKAAIDYVMDSQATIAIVPFGDLLALEDKDARINEPGTVDDKKNWVCRAKEGVFTPELAAYYRRCIKKYGRMRK
jgi:4-alpha-glucanotransferase